MLVYKKILNNDDALVIHDCLIITGTQTAKTPNVKKMVWHWQIINSSDIFQQLASAQDFYYIVP